MILPSLLSLCFVLFCLTDSVKLKKRAADLASVLYPKHQQSTAVTKHLSFYCFKALLVSKERVLTRQKFLFRHLFESFSFLPVQTHRNILRWGVESSWRWHSMLWYSNGVIHQQDNTMTSQLRPLRWPWWTLEKVDLFSKSIFKYPQHHWYIHHLLICLYM